jgi:hypothetical protein
VHLLHLLSSFLLPSVCLVFVLCVQPFFVTLHTHGPSLFPFLVVVGVSSCRGRPKPSTVAKTARVTGNGSGNGNEREGTQKVCFLPVLHSHAVCVRLPAFPFFFAVPCLHAVSQSRACNSSLSLLSFSLFFFFFFTPGAGEALLPRVTFLCVRAFARVFRVGCGGLDTRCLD